MPIELACEALGAGPPVVILHGLFGAGCNWSEVARSLASRYRVYLPDARNHGASPWSDNMSYPKMALDVKVLIERERLQRPILVGHSMGGKTAMTLALSHPELVGGVAVIDIAPEHYAEQFSTYVTAMRSLDLAAASAAARRQFREALASSLRPDISQNFLMQNLRRHNERFDWRLNLMATAVCMPDLCAFPEALPHRCYEGPALFLSGEESDYVRKESQARILALFPEAEFGRIPDAGHWVHADQPQALLCGLHDWLSEVHATVTR
nr:alpha/beta fold hydrolase [uncultured Albidiferax sp.]